MSFSRALLFGTNYSGSNALKGCHNDVELLEETLRSKLLFKQIEVYQGPQVTGNMIVTRIMDAVQNTHKDKNTNLWIHFSGHGTRKYDRDGDELDGYDECIVPYDASSRGYLRDDFFRFAFSKVYEGTNVICTFDCCHSGTMADMPYVYTDSSTCEVHAEPIVPIKARVITISGCMDHEKSKEESVSREGVFNNRPMGVLTACIVDILSKKNVFISLFDFFEELQTRVRNQNSNQLPILCASHKIAHSSKLIHLV
jgi:hypothetical protein